MFSINHLSSKINALTYWEKEMRMGYLIDEDSQNREYQAVRKFLKTPIAREFFSNLGISPLSWFLLEVEQGDLLEDFAGDVDILAGNLAWENPAEFDALVLKNKKEHPGLCSNEIGYLSAQQLAQIGGVKWPPSFDYLVAIEAKCAYFEPKDNEVKAQKSSLSKQLHIQRQVQKLLQMGFDKVVLLDFIINPPVSGNGIDAWLQAVSVAIQTEKKMSRVLQNRLPGEFSAGHFVLSLGAVAGGDEVDRGSASPKALKPPVQNALLQEETVSNNRKEVEGNLKLLLESKAKPIAFPYILED